MGDLVESLNLLGAVWAQFMLRQAWQALVVFLVVGAVTFALRRSSAVLRYSLWLLVIVRFLLPPDFAFFTGAGYWLPRLGVRTEPELALSAPVNVPLREESPVRFEIGREVAPRSLADDERVEQRVPDRVPPSSVPRLTRSAILMLVWATVVFCVLILLMKRSRVAGRILREAHPVSDEEIVALAKECKVAVRLRRRVRFLSSAHVPMPVAIGLMRPSVVAPDRLLAELSREQLQAVLLHEFLHVKRLDPLVSFVQRVVQAFYVYHPVIWLANAMIDMERERACDDQVLALMQREAETYGETLVRAVELAPREIRASGGLVSIAESKRQLKDRLRRIAQVDRKLVHKLSVASVLAILCIGAVVLPLSQMDSGDTVEERQEPRVVSDRTASAKRRAAKGAEKTGGKDERRDEGSTDVKGRPRKFYGDALWREFMRAYQALDFDKAVSLGEEFLEKYGNDPEALRLYGLVAKIYGMGGGAPKEAADDKYKALLERGIVLCQEALEHTEEETEKAGMLLTLGLLCELRGFGPGWHGWHDKEYTSRAIASYREAIAVSERLLKQDDRTAQRVGRANLCRAYAELAGIFNLLEQFPEAVAVYEEALAHAELADERYSILEALARTYHKWGMRVEEMRTYLAAIEEAPIDRTYLKPSVKRPLIDTYRTAVSAARTKKQYAMQVLAKKLRRTSDLLALEAKDLGQVGDFQPWRISAWNLIVVERLLTVCELVADYYTEKRDLGNAIEPYVHLMETWPDDGRVQSKVLMKLGNVYEEFGHREEAVEAYRKVIQIDHDLTMGDRLEARSRLLDLGEEVKVVQRKSMTNERFQDQAEPRGRGSLGWQQRAAVDPAKESLEGAVRGVPQELAEARKAARRTLCRTNLRILSQVFHMYANEWDGRYPPIDDRRGNFMVEGDALFPRYAQYPDGVGTFRCPSRAEHDMVESTDAADAITDESYFYLGWVVTDEVEGHALLDAYERLDLGQRDKDIFVAKGKGNGGGDCTYRLREGMERFLITDIMDPAATAKAQDEIPVMWERPGNHSPAGGHVLYMSGRVEFVEYPGKFPMTRRFITRLIEMSEGKASGEKDIGAPESGAAPDDQAETDRRFGESTGTPTSLLPSNWRSELRERPRRRDSSSMQCRGSRGASM